MLVNIEDWILDRFIPWLRHVCWYGGLLFIFYQLDVLAVTYLKWAVGTVFGTAIVGSYLLVSLLLNRRVCRAIDEILNQESEAIKNISQDGLINYPNWDALTFKTVRSLRQDGFDQANLSQKVKDEIWSRYLRWKRKNDPVNAF
jgi:hypothetical protein